MAGGRFLEQTMPKIQALLAMIGDYQPTIYGHEVHRVSGAEQKLPETFRLKVIQKFTITPCAFLTYVLCRRPHLSCGPLPVV